MALSLTQVLQGSEAADVMTVAIDMSQPSDAQVVITKTPPTAPGSTVSGVAKGANRLVIALGDLPNLIAAAQKIAADYKTSTGSDIAPTVTQAQS